MAWKKVEREGKRLFSKSKKNICQTCRKAMLFVKNTWFVVCWSRSLLRYNKNITMGYIINEMRCSFQDHALHQKYHVLPQTRFHLLPVGKKKRAEQSIFPLFLANPLFDGRLLLILQRGTAVSFIEAAAEMAGGGKAHLRGDLFDLQLAEFQKLRRGKQAVS